MSSNPGGSQTQPIGVRTLSDLLVSFLKLTSPTATDLSNPNQVNVFGLSASVATGANPGTTVLNQLKLHDLIGLLSSLVFEVKTLTNGSVTSTISYQIIGSSPTAGNALANGHSFATHVGTLSLADIVALLPQATFSVATPPGSQGVPWTISGSVQTDVPQNPALDDPVGQFTAKYVFLLCHFFELTCKNNSTGAPIIAILDGNKRLQE
jgi:hypothetical protein